MCGITGFIGNVPYSAKVAQHMAMMISHRGPDDEGIWVDEEIGVALAHRRLSIIDISPAGHQPMISQCGRYVIVFNGEIYNHRELRVLLEKLGVAPKWHGQSDTETLLTALSYWGVEKTLNKLNGMFAFALWDRKDQQLWLARDRMGEKPLYYGLSKGIFLFGSELKALRAHPAWSGEIDHEAITLFLRYSYIPAPWSIFKGIRKLLPGHYILIKDKGQCVSEQRCYWDMKEVAEKGKQESFIYSPELIDMLEDQLLRSVAFRMESDVPLGAFLSGGVDSSTIVAMMQSQSSRPVRTFSIGFYETEFNEAQYAKAVAQHLGTDHTELYVTSKDALNVVPRLPEIWDEPFADSSQIPTLLLSQLTKKYVTVALSGDGGDELFGGYSRYILTKRLWRWLKPVPFALRRAASGAILNWLSKFSRVLNGDQALIRHSFLRLIDKIYKAAEVMDISEPEILYHRLISHWKEPEKVVLGAAEPKTILLNEGEWPKLLSFTERVMWLDQLTYLPDDILVKVDRASMAVSLETRIPLLDHNLVEFAWHLPASAKIHNKQGKWLLRQVLYRYVPRELVDRPKQGFGVPIENWLRGPLRDWAESLLDEKRLGKDGFFNSAIIRRVWTEHLSGLHGWHYYLWDVLMFQAWLENIKPIYIK